MVLEGCGQKQVRQRVVKRETKATLKVFWVIGNCTELQQMEEAQGKETTILKRNSEEQNEKAEGDVRRRRND